MKNPNDINMTEVLDVICKDVEGMSFANKIIIDAHGRSHNPSIIILDIGLSFPELYTKTRRDNQT